MVVMPLVMASTPAVELGAPLAPQHQRGETLSYLLGFAVLCPLALVAAQRLAPALAARAGDAGLSALLAILAAGLLGALVLVKALERAGASGGVLWVLGAAAVWWALAAALVARTLRPRPWRVLAALGPHAALAWGAVAAVGLVAVLCFAVLGSIDRVALALGLRGGGRRHRGRRAHRPPGPAVAGGAGCSTSSCCSRSWRWCRTC